MPLLSICIPTYNRATLLAEALSAIADQVDTSMCSQIELIVSDNASTDNTAVVVHNLASRRPDLRLIYRGQDENLGADGNINALFRIASTPWVLYLSDDDLLLPGALREILLRLQVDPRLAALILNSKTFTVSPDENTPQNLPTDRDLTFDGKDDALRFLGTFVTFLSVMVFRREWLAGHEYGSRVGTDFIQSYIFLDVLSQGGPVSVVGKPYLAIRSNNTGGYAFFRAFVTRFAELMDYAESKGFSRSTTRSVLKGHQRFISNFVKLFKVRGTFGSLKPDFADGARRILMVYASDPLFLLKILPLMLLPGALFRPLHRVFRWARAWVTRRPSPAGSSAHG